MSALHGITRGARGQRLGGGGITFNSVGEDKVLRLLMTLSYRLNTHLIVRAQLACTGHLLVFAAFIDEIAAVWLVTVKCPEDETPKRAQLRRETQKWSHVNLWREGGGCD